jgi:hypothetical protein
VAPAASDEAQRADTPDGDGTLFDHTLLYWGSGMSNGNAHDRFNPPAVVMGGANGAMRGKGNQHIVVNREPAVNLLVSLAELAGVRVEKIGSSTGKVAL